MTTNVTVNFEDFPNIGIVHCKLPTDILDVLNKRIEEIEKSNFQGLEDNRKNLLGHMEREYKLLDCIPILEPFLLKLVDAYEEKYKYVETIGNVEGKVALELSHLWVNYQKKYEFNPPHLHSGVFSFVIWLKIPYDLEKEEAVFPITSGGLPRTSKFTFHYSNILGKMGHWVIPVDKSYEGVVCMFPSDLSHSVNPFYTSDNYRVSISGNLKMVAVNERN